MRIIELVKENAKDLVMILIGNLLLAFSITYFILPYEILTGGIFGVAIALKPLLPWFDTNYIAYAIIALTFILGAVFLGRSFALKTVISSVVYPIFLEMFRLIPFEVNTDPLLASLYGGLLTGVAVGLVFRAKGSTGGMDIFPLIMNKYLGIKHSQGMLLVDGLTVILGLSTLGVEHVLLGLISVFASSFTIDRIIMLGSESAKSVYIISDYLEVINDRIQNEIERGTTIIKASGGYSKEPRDIIMCVITVEQYPVLQEIVQEEDENAFIIVNEAHEILGEGFSYGPRI